mmetsp:Transcript_9280/g.17743  ORF Transcript_9280/g.17743 Transcript_9280/m.17743 type:complete len:222 (-) Transcript_9280:22-687(-)
MARCYMYTHSTRGHSSPVIPQVRCFLPPCLACDVFHYRFRARCALSSVPRLYLCVMQRSAPLLSTPLHMKRGEQSSTCYEPDCLCCKPEGNGALLGSISAAGLAAPSAPLSAAALTPTKRRDLGGVNRVFPCKRVSFAAEDVPIDGDDSRGELAPEVRAARRTQEAARANTHARTTRAWRVRLGLRWRPIISSRGVFACWLAGEVGRGRVSGDPLWLGGGY